MSQDQFDAGLGPQGQISDTELYAAVGMSSASTAMFDRRRRILKEAQAMLAEDGVASFSTMELSRRSGVAQRTIFNAFGNRDTLLALVIRFYFEQFSQAIEQRFDLSDLNDALGRLATTTLRNTQLRNYMSAVVSLHFSPSAPEAVRAVTSNIGAGFFLPWLVSLRDARQLPPGCDVARLTRNLANAQYAVVQDWLTGVLETDAVLGETLDVVLSLMAGALRGKARTLLDAYLSDLRQGGPLQQAIVQRARDEVEMLFPPNQGKR